MTPKETNETNKKINKIESFAQDNSRKKRLRHKLSMAGM